MGVKSKETSTADKTKEDIPENKILKYKNVKEAIQGSSANVSLLQTAKTVARTITFWSIITITCIIFLHTVKTQAFWSSLNLFSFRQNGWLVNQTKPSVKGKGCHVQ